MAVRRTIKASATPTSWAIGEAFEEFIAEKEGTGKSPSTIRNYKQSYQFFMEFCDFAHSDTLDLIEPSLFYKWSGNLALEGVKHTSINHYIRDVRAFLYWCMEEPREYMRTFKIKEVSGQEEVIKFFTDEELLQLLEKPSTKNPQFPEWRVYTIVNWVLATGNRASTICNVRLGDIDFKRKEITLAHTKNKKAQILPLSPSLETVLKEYLRTFNFTKYKNPWLFSRVDEEQLTTNALRQAFRKYCQDRGVNHTNIHGLRHSFARNWIKNNGSMYDLQMILGHSTLEMTRRYIKLFSEDIKTDFERYNPLDNIKKKARRTQTIKPTGY